MEIENIKRKLRGILAKTKDGSGTTEAESNAALEYARRLMLRHQLTEADLTDKERTPHEIAADTEYDRGTAYATGARLPVWQNYLGTVIAEIVGTVGCYLAGVETKVNERGNVEFDSKGEPLRRSTLKFYGPKGDVRSAIELFDEWVVLITALSRMKFGSVAKGDGRGYAIGFTHGMWTKISEIKLAEKKLIDKAPPVEIGDAVTTALCETGDTCSGLVVVKSNEIMKAKKKKGSEWLKDTYNVKLGSHHVQTRGTYSDESFDSGVSDGRKANMQHTPTKKLN